MKFNTPNPNNLLFILNSDLAEREEWVEEEQYVVNTVDPKEISNENNINIVNTRSDKQKVVKEAQKLGYG